MTGSPLIGSLVVADKGWRWTQWTILFFTSVLIVPIYFMRETYKTTLLRRRAAKYNIKGPPQSQRTTIQHIRHFVTTTITRPIHMLFTEPVVGLVSLYGGFTFSLISAFVASNPYIFSTVYNFQIRAQGLSFLGFAIGCLLGPTLLILIEKYLYQPRAALSRSTHSRPEGENSTVLATEHRLYGALLGSILLPLGLFISAWTFHPTIHWLCPIFFQALFMCGGLAIYVSTTVYMVEMYGPLYAASAVGANSLVRYTLSAVFPLFVLQMYEGLGVGGATSLLGGCAVLMMPIPWVFWRCGAWLRGRSGYRHGV